MVSLYHFSLSSHMFEYLFNNYPELSHPVDAEFRHHLGMVEEVFKPPTSTGAVFFVAISSIVTYYWVYNVYTHRIIHFTYIYIYTIYIYMHIHDISNYYPLLSWWVKPTS